MLPARSNWKNSRKKKRCLLNCNQQRKHERQMNTKRKDTRSACCMLSRRIIQKQEDTFSRSCGGKTAWLSCNLTLVYGWYWEKIGAISRKKISVVFGPMPLNACKWEDSSSID